MDRGIYVALSGAVIQERRLEVLTDNLANVNTAGFKKQKPLFEDAMPRPFGTRTFAKIDKVFNDLSQGFTEKTDRKLDVALRGDGFFVVNTTYGNRYTRDGSFNVASDGTLTTREGNPVMGEAGVIKLTSPDVTIDADGNIKDKGAVTGRLKVVSFDKPDSIVREGSYFAPSSQGVNEVKPKNTVVDQGYVEVSNVNAITAMTSMIEALRSYETHTKMIQSLDDMTKQAIEEVGKVG